MAKKPMEEGETRAFKMYIPDLNRVVDFTFKAGPMSEICWATGPSTPSARSCRRPRWTENPSRCSMPCSGSIPAVRS